MGKRTTSIRPVLVIEPHEDSRLSLLELLRASGYTAIGVASGKTALTMLRKGLRPCVILLEFLSPGNGFDFRLTQRADPELAGIPVIGAGTTARSQDDVDEAARVDHYLVKPFDVDELLDTVRDYCA